MRELECWGEGEEAVSEQHLEMETFLCDGARSDPGVDEAESTRGQGLDQLGDLSLSGGMASCWSRRLCQAVGLGPAIGVQDGVCLSSHPSSACHALSPSPR